MNKEETNSDKKDDIDIESAAIFARQSNMLVNKIGNRIYDFLETLEGAVGNLLDRNSEKSMFDDDVYFVLEGIKTKCSHAISDADCMIDGNLHEINSCLEKLGQKKIETDCQ